MRMVTEVAGSEGNRWSHTLSLWRMNEAELSKMLGCNNSVVVSSVGMETSCYCIRPGLAA